MESLFQYWSYQYYTAPLLISVVIWCLIVLIKRGNLIEPHRLHWYAIAMLILWITNSVLFIVCYKTPYQETGQQMFRYVDLLFLEAEVLLFSHFYYYRMHSLSLKKLTLVINLFFACALIALVFTTKPSDIERLIRLRGWLFAVESLFLLFLGSAYFFTLFRERILRNLTDIPGYWVAAGITLLMLVSIPLAIGEILFFRIYWLWSGFYAIYYLLYTTLFILIIRACYCKKTERFSKEKDNTTQKIPFPFN